MSSFNYAALIVVALAVTALASAHNCGIRVTPCDMAFTSPQNQTFAFQGAGPDLQLKAYFGKGYDACLSNRNETPIQFYYTVCSTPASLFTFEPKNVKTYISYRSKHSQSLCLTRAENQTITSSSSSSSSSSFHYDLIYDDCCFKSNSTAPTGKCSREHEQRQLWIEPPTTKNPYNQIIGRKVEKGASASGKMCLTRVSSSC